MKTTLALGAALAWIALCFFVQSSLGQEAVTPPVVETDNDDVDGDESLRGSATFSTKIIGGKFAKKALCPHCREITTAGSNFSSSAGPKICSGGLWASKHLVR